MRSESLEKSGIENKDQELRELKGHVYV